MKIKIVSSALLLSFVLLATPALAVGNPDTLSGRPSGTMPVRAQNRLTEVKLKVCQARENAIKTRFERLNQFLV